MSWLGQFAIGICLGIILLIGFIVWLATKKIG